MKCSFWELHQGWTLKRARGDSIGEDLISKFTLSSFWICHKCVCCQCRAAAACSTWLVPEPCMTCGPDVLPAWGLRTFTAATCASEWGSFTSHPPPYWVTTEGDRRPEELESLSRRLRWSPNPLHTCSRGLSSRCAHTCYTSRGDGWRHIWRSYCSFVRYSDNTCEALVEYLAESLEDLLFHVSCVTDVVGSTRKNIIFAAGALKIDFKRHFGTLSLRLST